MHASLKHTPIENHFDKLQAPLVVPLVAATSAAAPTTSALSPASAVSAATLPLTALTATLPAASPAAAPPRAAASPAAAPPRAAASPVAAPHAAALLVAAPLVAALPVAAPSVAAPPVAITSAEPPPATSPPTAAPPAATPPVAVPPAAPPSAPLVVPLVATASAATQATSALAPASSAAAAVLPLLAVPVAAPHAAASPAITASSPAPSENISGGATPAPSKHRSGGVDLSANVAQHDAAITALVQSLVEAKSCSVPPQIVAAASPATAPATSVAAAPPSLSSAVSEFPCGLLSHGGQSIAADSLLADVGTAGSNNVVAVINAGNINLAAATDEPFTHDCTAVAADFNIAVDCGFTHSSAANFAAANKAMPKAMQADAIKTSIVSTLHQNDTAAARCALAHAAAAYTHYEYDVANAFEQASSPDSANTHIYIEPPLRYDEVQLQLSTPHVHEQLGSNEVEHASIAALEKLQASAIDTADAWPWQTPTSASITAATSILLFDDGQLGSHDVVAAIGNSAHGAYSKFDTDAFVSDYDRNRKCGYSHDASFAGANRQMHAESQQPESRGPSLQTIASVISTSLPANAALCDNGSTIHCSKDGVGRLAGTFTESDGPFDVGERSSSLTSHGQHWHAITLIDSIGVEVDNDKQRHYKCTVVRYPPAYRH